MAFQAKHDHRDREAPDEESAKIFDAHYKFAIGELTKADSNGRHSEKRLQLKKELQALGDQTQDNPA